MNAPCRLLKSSLSDTCQLLWHGIAAVAVVVPTVRPMFVAVLVTAAGMLVDVAVLVFVRGHLVAVVVSAARVVVVVIVPTAHLVAAASSLIRD